LVDITADARPVRQPRLETQQVAWGVILLSFAVFCLLCIAAGIGLHYFVFKSTVPMVSVLTVGRGTVGLTGTDLIEQVVRDRRELLNSSIITTDRQSQATLNFIDQRSDRQLVAAVTINNNTRLDLDEVSRPRFEWSASGYEINLSDVSGRLDIFMPHDVGREVRLTVSSPAGTAAVFTAPGQYSVNSTAEQLIINNLNGIVTVLPAHGQYAQTIASGQRGLIVHETGELSLSPMFTELIAKRTFDQTNVFEASAIGTQVREAAWGCYNTLNDYPIGAYGLTIVDGRPALQFVRGGGAQSHGETGCVYTLGPTGRGFDVSEFDYLGLQVIFKIHSHSLSTCGIQGSECPLMLRMDYIPVTGQPAVSWYHGFFVNHNEQLNYPQICDSCTQEHEAVNDDAWYTYQSDNLFALIPPNLHPASILNLRIYASGHEYDVYVSQVGLFGGQMTAPVLAAAE
jgi:hypothetical protein